MWRLAWRNLWRNRARTVITGTAIAFTLGIQLMSYGIAESSYEKMIGSAVKAVGGALLVHADGYWETLQTDKVISDSPAALMSWSGELRTVHDSLAQPSPGSALPRPRSSPAQV